MGDALQSKCGTIREMGRDLSNLTGERDTPPR